MLDTKNVDETAFQRMWGQVSEQRREKARKYQFRKDAVLSLCGEMLIRYGYSKHFGIGSPITFRENDYGKLYVQEADNFYFNLSHSGHYVICAVAKEEVGVDIEEIRQDLELEISRFFHPKEYHIIMQAGDEQQIPLFFRYWTAKESYIKYRGMGLSLELSSFYFNKGKIYTKEGIPNGVVTFYNSISHYQIALCTSIFDKQNQFFFVSMEELFLSDNGRLACYPPHEKDIMSGLIKP